MTTPRRIVVLHQSGDPSMDLLLSGIDDYRRSYPGWVIRHQYDMPERQAELEDLTRWQPDGILAVCPLSPLLQKLRLPCVSLRHTQTAQAVISDDGKVGTAAAAYLADLGSASLACLQPERTSSALAWQTLRLAGFHAELGRRALTATIVHWQTYDGQAGVADHILGQLRSLPRPCAVFAGNDYLAVELAELVIANGLRVPADIAILGADDVPRCATAQVPLSSVRVAHRSIGRRGAELLEGLLAGRIRGPVTEALPPEGIAERASTDGIEVADPEVAAVLAFIRGHAGEPFTVDDAISASSLGRRSIEQRFRDLLHRSILSEIQHARIKRACVMLQDQHIPLGAVADACGFGDQQRFTSVFGRIMGMPPSLWRRRHKGGPAAD